jgi:hypothetical protein
MTGEFRISSTCDAVVTDPHVHNIWELAHRRGVEQHSVYGLDLEPTTFTVVAWGAQVDMGLVHVYGGRYCRFLVPRMGLS